jgi:peptidoglycan/LPS O-acetylase OafA/YrhL
VRTRENSVDTTMLLGDNRCQRRPSFLWDNGSPTQTSIASNAGRPQPVTTLVHGEILLSNPASSLNYRPDIDGLRAVAVLLVIAYHVVALKIWGGFIGVDVFFVISGFLISSVILREIEEGQFSLLVFYERRIRRIFPALMVMLFVTAIFSSVYLLPSELIDFAKSLVAAVFSASNVYFLEKSDYFATPNASTPLLHTWSLAVEEQFYILFPLFLLLIRRFVPGNFRKVVILVASASFAVSVIGAYAFPTATFYLPVTRAWELLLGTMLSLGIFPTLRLAIWRNLAAAVGLVSIVACGFIYGPRTHFPGLAAVPPCLGAALIIAAGQEGTSVVGRLLSMKPVVFIGLISYSLYIWHWPIIVFQRMSMIQVRDASSRSVKGGLLVFMIIVATLSWRYIETPFRKGRLMLKGGGAFKFASASAVALTSVAVAIIALHGLPSRYTPEEVQISSYMEREAPYRLGTCFISSGKPSTDFDVSTCLRQDPHKKNYLLIGDSHAAQLWYGLDTVFPEINILQATASGCEPTLQHVYLYGDQCTPIMEYVYGGYLPKHPVDRILIAARWEQGDLPRLDDTMRRLKQQGLNVVLFGPIVQYDSPLPRLLTVSLKENDPTLPFKHRLNKYRKLDEEMAYLAENTWHVPYVSLFQLLCPQNACTEYAQKDVPLQFDYGHLTQAGSVLVAERLKAENSLGTR